MSDIDLPTSSKNQDHGSYSSGLIVGFLAGAVGYFLSQTQEGKEIRKKFSGHWHELREKLIAEGKLSSTELEITDYIAAARSKITEFLEGSLGDNTQPAKTTPRKKQSRSKKKLFKGI